MTPNRCLALGLILLGTACAGETSTRFLSLGTAGTAGIYYPLGGAMASRLSLADPDRQYTAEVTGGSVENVNRVARGEMDLAFAMATAVYEAYRGGRDFPRALRELRIVAPLYPNVAQVLVARNSDARSVSDFGNQRVSVGAPGSGAEQLARHVLAAYDLTYDDIDVRYLSFRESSDALRDGAIDAAIFSVGYPASAVLEATATGGARLLHLDESHQTRLTEQYPYYGSAMIPAGAYPAMDEPIPTVRVLNWIVATEALDSAVVVSVLDLLQNERAELARVNTIAEQIDLAALDHPPIPLHPAVTTWLSAQSR